MHIKGICTYIFCRGVKPAVPNVGLQIGLQDTPLGNSKARYLLAACHIPPPSSNSMQLMANKVSDKITDLNTHDMCTRRKAISKLRKDVIGCSSLNVSLDARYNTTTFGSRSKSGQNASQAIMTAVNADGNDREIIDLFVQNKLCYEGSWLRSHGYSVTCPGHPCCTSNTKELSH